MQSAETSQFTYQDYLYLKNINIFLISELCFPDNEEPLEETFDNFRENHFMKLVKIQAKYVGNIKNTIYASIAYGYIYFAIIENETYLMDNNEIYKLVADYFKKIDKMTVTQKIKHFIFSEGLHNTHSVSSLAFYVCLKNRCFAEIREMIIEKYEKEIKEEKAEIHSEKIAEFYVEQNKKIYLRYCSSAQLYIKIMEHLFDEFIAIFECSFERYMTIDENMERIVFCRNFCENREIKIFYNMKLVWEKC